MEVSTRSIQSTDDRGFRDFAGGRTEYADSILIGILCGVSGGDSRCGRDRGSNVSRKKRPGGAMKWDHDTGKVLEVRPPAVDHVYCIHTSQ